MLLINVQLAFADYVTVLSKNDAVLNFYSTTVYCRETGRRYEDKRGENSRYDS